MVGSVRVLIVGCGYVGMEVARQWSVAGAEVVAVRRSATGMDEAQAMGIGVRRGDITDGADVAGWPGGWDVVVNAVSSGRGGVEAYRQVYLEGTRHLMGWMGRVGVGCYVHLGSTSVYGQTDGGWVDEGSATVPGSETGGILVEAERLVLAARDRIGLKVRLLRVAGIYGPGRGHLWQQLMKGEARIQGDGLRWVNMVHRDDVASAVRAVTGPCARDVYNVVDDEPVRQGEFVRWLAEEFGRPVPPVATREENAVRKRALTHKRVSNARLRDETGWRPRYPTFREGYSREGDGLGLGGSAG